MAGVILGPIRRLRRSGGVVLLSGALVIALGAACGGSADSPSAVASAAPTGDSVQATAPSTGSASPGPTVDGKARLAAAFQKLLAGYRFDSTVTVAGQVATHAGGRWLKGRSELVVDSGGTALTYRTVPPRSWVYQDGTGWVELAGTAPSGDPLAPLRKPTSVSVVSDDANGLVVQATYPPKTLGVAGSDPVVVQISIGSDGTSTATYTVATAAGPATSVTVLAPGVGLQPIVVPSPAN